MESERESEDELASGLGPEGEVVDELDDVGRVDGGVERVGDESDGREVEDWQ